MKQFISSSGKTATIELAHPAFDPTMDVYWLKIKWPDGRIYLDTVYFTEGRSEARLIETGNFNHEEWAEI